MVECGLWVASKTVKKASKGANNVKKLCKSCRKTV